MGKNIYDYQIKPNPVGADFVLGTDSETGTGTNTNQETVNFNLDTIAALGPWRIGTNNNLSFIGTEFVGIGTETPIQRFTVADGNLQVGVSNNIALTYDETSGSDWSMIGFNNTNSAQYLIGYGTNHITTPLQVALKSNDVGGSIGFYTLDTERMRINSDGKIGINTASPLSTLHINGSVFIDADISSENAISIKNASSNRTYIMKVNTLDGFFRLYDDTVNKTRFTISTSGNIGIGTNTPLTALDIVGNMSLTENINLQRSISGIGTEGSKIILGDIQTSSPYISSYQADTAADQQGIVFYDHPSTTASSPVKRLSLYDGINFFGANQNMPDLANVITNYVVYYDNTIGRLSYALAPAGGGGSVWGAITGSLPDQLDLNIALNGKQVTITGAATTIASSDLTTNRALISDAAGKVSVSATAATELNNLSGVTSNIQTQLNSKQATITGAATTIINSDLITNRALTSDASGKVDVSLITTTELGYLTGATSNIQNQLNNTQPITGGATTIVTDDLTVNRALISDALGKVAVSTTASTELNNLTGVTSNIQTQLDGKEDSFTKNSAFNKDFAGSGIATTTSRSDHNHDATYLGISANADSATKWQTARQITVAVSGDGSGSVATVMDGTSNATLTVPLTVNKANVNYWTLATSELYYTGNVGIGNTNPVDKLHVTGNIYAEGTVTATGEIEAFTTSDERLKTDIVQLNSNEMSQFILKLKPIQYIHIVKEKHEIGLIAQEVEKYFPEIVKEDGDGYKMIQYSKLVIPLISTIQKQQHEIEQLNARLLKIEQKLSNV